MSIAGARQRDRTSAQRRERAAAQQLRQTADVVAAAVLPRRLSAEAVRALRAPVALASGFATVALVLVAAVVVDASGDAWGDELVAAAVAAVALALPVGRLLLASAPLGAVVERSAPLLRALEVDEASIARHWTLAAVLPAVAATTTLGGTAAIVLGARGAVSEALVIVCSIAVGSAVASALARRSAATRIERDARRPAWTMPARRLALLAVVGCSAPALAPLLRDDLRLDAAQLAAAASAGALAAAVWIVGDLLAADARAVLRLCRALVDAGAPGARVVWPLAGGALAWAAAVAASIGAAAGAAAADAELGVRAGAAALVIGLAAPAVLALEPARTALLGRTLAFALVISPAAVSLVGGGGPGWTIAAAVAVGAVGVVALMRRIA